MGLFGSLFGSDAKTKVKNEGPTPWKEQSPFLTYGFNEAKNLYNQQAANPYYQGSTYAQLTPEQYNALSLAQNYAVGQGADLANTAAGAAVPMIDAGAQYGANAQALLGQAGRNTTRQTIRDAAQYASNPYMDGMVDAASRDVGRVLGEQTLPGLADAAIQSGNTNSTQYEVANALARRDAGDRVADISAGLRGDAYQNGLTLAQAGIQNQMANRLAANAQVGNAFNSGLSGLDRSQQMANTNFDNLLTAGNVLQQNNQGILDEAFQRWQGQQQQPWANLGNFWNIVGSGGFDTVGPTTVQQGGSSGIFGRVTGGLKSLGNAVGAFR